MGPNVEWLAGLSPWPQDGFGLERVRALLTQLGDPQDSFEAIHVVGTNGKSTATKTIEAALVREGLVVGATVSPHVSSWAERVTVNGQPVDLEAALGRVRSTAMRLGATQFESVTAAALTEFAERSVAVAVVEAGLGGRHDATNVLRTRVVLLTNVGLDHTDVLGETLGEIAAEKLAVARAGVIVVLPDDGFADLVPAGAEVRVGGVRETVEAFIGRPVPALPEVGLPGRLERRESEIRDGAHNPDGVRWLAARLDPVPHVLCLSIVRDKNVDAMLRGLSPLGAAVVATTSSNPRALPASELASLAEQYFEHVECVEHPREAVERAHAIGEPVLVTGSLYLLADLAAEAEEAVW